MVHVKQKGDELWVAGKCAGSISGGSAVKELNFYGYHVRSALELFAARADMVFIKYPNRKPRINWMRARAGSGLQAQATDPDSQSGVKRWELGIRSSISNIPKENGGQQK